MLTTTQALLASAALTWLMIMLPATVKLRLWTPGGFRLAAGNRESSPEPSPWIARAERAARNMLENMVLFVAVVAAAHFANKAGQVADLGASIFFFARIAYWFAYLAGIPYLRTGLWLVGVVGMILIGIEAA